VPKAKLITDTFDVLCQGIATGELPFYRLRQARYTNTEMNSTKVRDITKNIVNSLIEAMSLSFYSVVSIEVDISMFLNSDCRDRLPYLLKRPEWEYKTSCGVPRHIIHLSDEVDRPKIEDEMERELLNEVMGADQYGYWYKLMIIQENHRLIDPLPERPIHYCVIDANPDSDHKILLRAFENLKNQSFTNWTAVYFVDKLTEQNSKYVRNQTKGGFRLKLVVHSESIGRNYEIGIIKHCPNGSFALVLGRNESLPDPEGLEMLAYSLAPRSVLGAFVGI
jgi:hypothetical protein